MVKITLSLCSRLSPSGDKAHSRSKAAGSSWPKEDVKTSGTAEVNNLGHLCSLASAPLIKTEGQCFSEPMKLAETRSVSTHFMFCNHCLSDRQN